MDQFSHSIPDIVTDEDVAVALETLGQKDPETGENWPMQIYQILTVVFAEERHPRLIPCLGNKPTKEQIVLLIECLAHEYDIRPMSAIRTELFYHGCSCQNEMHQSGYVYLLECEQGEFYKIGRTNDLNRRMDQFGIQLPFKISLRHTIKVPDMVCAEAALHSKFASRRTNGEWFKLSIEDVDWFCQMPNYMG